MFKFIPRLTLKTKADDFELLVPSTLARFILN